MMIIAIVISWQWIAKVIGNQKIYGLFGLNNRILEMCDVNCNIIHQIMLVVGDTQSDSIQFCTYKLKFSWSCSSE